jgi:hypothetical protein
LKRRICVSDSPSAGKPIGAVPTAETTTFDAGGALKIAR